MNIVSSISSGLRTAVVFTAGVIASANNDGLVAQPPPKDLPPPSSISKPYVPGSILLAQADKAEKKEEVNKPASGIQLITKRHIDLIKKTPDSIFAYEILKSPIISISDEVEKFARDNKNSFAAMAIAMRLPKDRITKEDIEASRKEPGTKFYFGLNQNPNRPFEKEDFEKLKTSNEYHFSIIARGHMTDEVRKLITDEINLSKWYVYYGVQNPDFIDSQKSQELLRDMALKCPGSWAAEGAPVNPRFNPTDQIILNSLKQPTTLGARTLLKSKNLKITPMALAFANVDSNVKSNLGKHVSYYGELYPYNSSAVKDVDKDAAQEFYTSTYAKIVMSNSATRVTKDQIDFALKDTDHANSAYAVGTFSNPSTEITNDHLEWVVSSKENANTYAAYEISRRLTWQQFNTVLKRGTFRNIMKGPFCDTLAGKGAGENYSFASLTGQGFNIFGSDDRKFIREIRFSQGAYGSVSSIAFIPDEDDKKEAKGEFAPPAYSFNMGRNVTWGKISDAEQDYMISNPTKSLSLGLAGNINLERNEKLSTFVQKLTKTSPKSQILYEITVNPKWVSGLEAKQRDEETKSMLENPDSKTAEGYFENSEVFIGEDIKKVLRENPNSRGALGAAKNSFGFIVGLKDIEFALSEKGQKTLFGSTILSRWDFPGERLIEEARKTNSGHLRLAILFHPAFQINLADTEFKLGR